MSNDFKFLTFDGRLFHSLSAATEYDKYSHSNVPLITAGVYQFITWLMINTCFMTVRVIRKECGAISSRNHNVYKLHSMPDKCLILSFCEGLILGGGGSSNPPPPTSQFFLFFEGKVKKKS